jgi:hypothetical protein
MSLDGRRFRALAVVALISLSPSSHAQAGTAPPESPLVVEGLGRGTVALDGPWQFRTGDDMDWANPGFDDSNWEQIDISRSWGEQGHWAYAGYAWYRRQIEFKTEPDGAAEVSLFVPDAACAYEVYWNGRLIGRTGRRFPLPPEVDDIPPALFQLGGAGRGVLALRVLTRLQDTTTKGDELGLMNVPRLGNDEAIRSLAVQVRAETLKRELLDIGQVAIYAQLFLLGFVVWARNRERKLLFWMAVFFLSAALWVGLNAAIFPGLATSVVASGDEFHTLEDVALWFLLLYLLELDRYPQLVRWTQILGLVSMLCATLDFALFVHGWSPSLIPTEQFLDAGLTAGFALPQIYPLILIPFAFRKRMDPARRFVAVAAFLSDMYFVVWHTTIQGRRFTRWTLGDTMMRPVLTVEGVAISVPSILTLLLVCAIVYAVYHYTVEQGERQISLEQEYRNAREVQQVLIPEATPHVPGFAIDSCYKPAGQVGGDFFQILATLDGGVLAVIGDVSGKGMPAAMTVSLLVGTVRTLAHYTQSPGEILAAMNQRMLGRSQGGFTTCLVLRADGDGTLTIANAGHIAPYIAGNDLRLSNGLPLGLAADTTYAECFFKLAPGEQLTLLTDGVVEAREKTGALFGFERTAAISTHPAEAIAAAAQAFGQDDDITVLTVSRTVSLNPALA